MADEELILDLTNFKDRVGSRVAPGRYRVQVEDVETTQSNNGNSMINLFLRVLGGEYDTSNIVDRLVLTEKSLFRVVGFMQAIGMPTPKKRIKLNPRTFVGKVLEIDVEDGEPYNGRVKSEVRSYYKPQKTEGGSTGADLEDVTGESGETAAEPAETASESSDGLEEFADDEEGSETSTEALDLDDVKL